MCIRDSSSTRTPPGPPPDYIVDGLIVPPTGATYDSPYNQPLPDVVQPPITESQDRKDYTNTQYDEQGIPYKSYSSQGLQNRIYAFGEI